MQQDFTISAEEMQEFIEFKELKQATEKMCTLIGRTNETMTAAIGAVNGNARILAGAAPAPLAVDDKKLNGMVDHLAGILINDCDSDEEQFLALGKLRERMAAYWDEQSGQSEQISKVNNHRAQTLGEFIKMTLPR